MDKGRGVAILNLDDCYAKLDSIRADKSKFTKINTEQEIHPIIAKENSISYYVLKYLKGYSNEIIRSLILSGRNPGKLCGLIKVHKEGNPARPVVSMIGTPEYQRWSRGHKALGQGQGHKKKSEAKDSLSEDRHSRGQGQECSRPRPRTKDTSANALQKKKKVFTKMLQAISKKKKVFTKIFQAISTKKLFQKIFQALHKILTIQKIALSSIRGQANFRGLEASRPRT